jgi:hypothetical protein
LEKVAFALWRPTQASTAPWSARLLQAADRLAELGLERLKINVPDVADPPDDPYTAMKAGAPDAMVSGFLNSALFAAPVERELAPLAGRIAGYAVTESTVLPNAMPADGLRSPGFSQVCFFKRLPHLSREDLLRIWLGDHTRVAVETQTTHYYNQNIITRALTVDAPDWDCIVEERFPDAALADRDVYFDAVGAPERLAAHTARMDASCARFIRGDGLKLLMSGEYRFGGWRDAPLGWREAERVREAAA